MVNLSYSGNKEKLNCEIAAAVREGETSYRGGSLGCTELALFSFMFGELCILRTTEPKMVRNCP